MQRVTLQLADDAADALHGGSDAPAAADPVKELAAEVGATLQPIHPGSEEPQLKRYFALDVADDVAADQVAAAFREQAEVEAAYVKPPASPP